jgi:predicted ATPase/DNA-binding SARP family transcriptional activator/Tfp pilus assembly protein PilF
MPRLSLSLLGPFQVYLDDARLTRFGTDKARALLAYLAVEAGVPHRREMLADLLWPDQLEAAARQNLRQALSRLGRALGNRQASPPFLLITPKTVAFNPESDHWLDVAVFTDQIAATRQHHHRRVGVCSYCTAQLEAAAALYRGDFLEGLSVDGGLPFEEWRLYTQELLHNQVMDALRLLAAYHERREAYPDSIRHARRQLALEPWREEAHRQLMRALALSGQRRAALAQYETCRFVLAEELRTTPEDATTALYQQIIAGGEAVGALRPPTYSHNLPTQLTPFVGRQTELTQVVHLLSNPDCRLLTVVGPGGVGKTRLALQAAAEHRYDFPDGVWFVPLAPVRSPDLLAASIAQGLGIIIESGQDPKAGLLAYLQLRETLLVLDNFEHLVEAADLLLDLLQAAPDLHLLVTSRERLNYQAEFLLTLEGLPYPVESGVPCRDDKWGVGSEKWEARGLEKLADYEAVQLFTERAGRVRAGFTTSADTLPHIIRVCQLVEGLPLGIELAAAWAQDLPLVEIAQQIQENLDFLAASHRDVPKRQRSIRATFEHSWNLLSEMEQGVYQQLSVFQGAFTLDAAAAVIHHPSSVILHPSPLPTDHRSQITDHLNSLTSKSLLRQHAAGGYDLHPILQQFAFEKLSEQLEEAGETHTHHAHYYLTFIQERETVLMGERSVDALGEIQGEIGNLRAAWEWAVTQREIDLLHQSASTLAYFYNRTGLFQEGEAVFRKASEHLFGKGENALAPLSPDHHTPRLLFARLQLEQARFLFGLGKYEHVPEHAQSAITLAAACQDRAIEAQANLFQGYVLHNQGKRQQARVCFERALSLAGEGLKHSHPSAGDQQRLRLHEVEANSLNSLAMVSRRLGHYDEAERYLEGSLRAARDADDLAGQSRALNGLGMVVSRRGDFSKALIFYQEALHYTQVCGDRRIEGALLNNLGNIYLRLGIYDEAGVNYTRALDIQREIGARQKEVAPGFNLGLINHYQGDQEAAQSHIQQAMQIAQELGDRRGQAFAWMGMGHTLLGLETLDGAREAYQASITLRRELGQVHLVTEPLEGLTRVALAQGETADAQGYIEEILDITRDCQKLDGLVDPFRVCLTCFRVLQTSGDPRAPEILHRAHQQLLSRAEKISDEKLRSSYLENITSHRALMRLYNEE